METFIQWIKLLLVYQEKVNLIALIAIFITIEINLLRALKKVLLLLRIALFIGIILIVLEVLL